MSFAKVTVTGQKAALKRILQLVYKGSIDPEVVRAARAITANVAARDDWGELDAIYNAVKTGTDAVPGLENGFRYVADPRSADYYVGAKRTLVECRAGACAGDCDEHTILVGALMAALGFRVGARAWGSDPTQDVFSHVYAIVAYPKKGQPDDPAGIGMDTTVPEADTGWQPASGRTYTLWIEDD